MYSKCTILGAHGLFVSAGCTTVGVYSGVTCNNIYELPQLVGARWETLICATYIGVSLPIIAILQYFLSRSQEQCNPCFGKWSKSGITIWFQLRFSLLSPPLWVILRGSRVPQCYWWVKSHLCLSHPYHQNILNSCIPYYIYDTVHHMFGSREVAKVWKNARFWQIFSLKYIWSLGRQVFVFFLALKGCCVLWTLFDSNSIQ